MPTYKNSKSQKRSQSKNGGRRRKQTKRKLRRGRKSRKVMRGGVTPYVMKLSSKSEKLYNILRDDDTIIDTNALTDLIHSPKYGYSANGWYQELFGEAPPEGMEPTDVKNAIIEKLEAGDQ